MDSTVYHAQLGQAAELMCRSDKYCTYPVACLAIWVKPAILLKQIHFFFNDAGSCIGYVTWARIAKDTERRLIDDPDVVLHVSEWNEGSRLWIMDFVAKSGTARGLLNRVRHLFPNDTEAFSLRRNDDGQVTKVVRWRYKVSTTSPEKSRA